MFIEMNNTQFCWPTRNSNNVLDGSNIYESDEEERIITIRSFSNYNAVHIVHQPRIQ